MFLNMLFCVYKISDLMVNFFITSGGYGAGGGGGGGYGGGSGGGYRR